MPHDIGRGAALRAYLLTHAALPTSSRDGMGSQRDHGARKQRFFSHTLVVEQSTFRRLSADLDSSPSAENEGFAELNRRFDGQTGACAGGGRKETAGDTSPTYLARGPLPGLHNLGASGALLQALYGLEKRLLLRFSRRVFI